MLTTCTVAPGSGPRSEALGGSDTIQMCRQSHSLALVLNHFCICVCAPAKVAKLSSYENSFQY